MSTDRSLYPWLKKKKIIFWTLGWFTRYLWSFDKSPVMLCVCVSVSTTVSIMKHRQPHNSVQNQMEIPINQIFVFTEAFCIRQRRGTQSERRSHGTTGRYRRVMVRFGWCGVLVWNRLQVNLVGHKKWDGKMVNNHTSLERVLKNPRVSSTKKTASLFK